MNAVIKDLMAKQGMTQAEAEKHNQYAMNQAGAFDDGDGHISIAEWQAYQASKGGGSPAPSAAPADDGYNCFQQRSVNAMPNLEQFVDSKRNYRETRQRQGKAFETNSNHEASFELSRYKKLVILFQVTSKERTYRQFQLFDPIRNQTEDTISMQS